MGLAISVAVKMAKEGKGTKAVAMMCAGMPFANLLGVPLGTFGMSIWLLHYSTRASFLLSCIMASNTLIAYPIVSRYGLQQKPSVTLSVGSSMLSLLIALIMLAGLVASFSSHDGLLFWVLFTAKFAAYCGIMIFLIPRLTRWFLRPIFIAIHTFI